MSKLGDAKQKALSKMNAAVSLVQKYPEIPKIGDMIAGDGGSIDLLVELLNAIGVNEQEIIAEVAKWLTGTTSKLSKSEFAKGILDSIEVTIKTLLLANLKNLFTCSMTPIIPDYLFEDTVYANSIEVGGCGVEINMDTADIYGLLDHCPVSVDGHTFYFDTIDAIEYKKTLDDVRKYTTKDKDGNEIRPYEDLIDEYLVANFPKIIETHQRPTIWYTYKKKGITHKTYDPLSLDEKLINTVVMHYYDVTGYNQTDVWKSRDFNAFLWYVINKDKSTWDNRNNLYYQLNCDQEGYEILKDDFFELEPDPTGKTEITLRTVQTDDGEKEIPFRKKFILDASYIERSYSTKASNVIKVYLNKDEYYHKRYINKPTGLQFKKVNDERINPKLYYEYFDEEKDGTYATELGISNWDGFGTYEFQKDKNGIPLYSTGRRISKPDEGDITKSKTQTNVTLETIWFNKTIFEFNYDYIFSLKLFEPRTLVAHIINALLNYSLTANFSTQQSMIAGVVGKMVDEYLIKTEEEIEDDFFSFSNEDYDRMLEEARLTFNGQYKSYNETGELINIDKDAILNSINMISSASTLEEQTSTIERTFRDVTVELSRQEEITQTAQFGFGMTTVLKLIKATVTEIVMQVLSPKVTVLYAINNKVMGDIDPEHKQDPIEFFKNAIPNLIKMLIKQVGDIVKELLFQFVKERLEPIIRSYVEKLAVEQAYKYYLAVKTAKDTCMGALDRLFNSTTGTSVIDNVTYADIIPRKTEPDK